MSVQIEIIGGNQRPGGWTFEAQTLDDDGSMIRMHLLLSWADYNLWSPDGSDPPAHVAEAALRFMLDRLRPAELPAKFDLSLARRRLPHADREIPGLIR